jgi:hypothetical protein
MSVYINISNEIDLLDEIYYLGEDDKKEIVEYIMANLDVDNMFELFLTYLKCLNISKSQFEQIKEACNVNDLFND